MIGHRDVLSFSSGCEQRRAAAWMITAKSGIGSRLFPPFDPAAVER
jgi:hypothetical protein